MPKDRLEKLRTKAFTQLLAKAFDHPNDLIIRNKLKKAKVKNYREYLQGVDQMVRSLIEEGWNLEDAKTQASILHLASLVGAEPKDLARRLVKFGINGLDDLSSYVLQKAFYAYEEKYKESPIASARPTARRMFEAVLMDLWPDSPAAITDFWLTDQKHYEALYYPIRRSEITVEDLGQVLGDPEAITDLVNSMPSNPHKGIVFGEPPSGGNGYGAML